MSTLVVSFCFAVVAASVWVRVALLPDYIGVPIRVPFKMQGANCWRGRREVEWAGFTVKFGTTK